MIATWKIPPIAKGMLSWVPVLNAIRKKRAATGGSESARYCYSVWLRHLSLLEPYGFNLQNACIGELGPGDSVGIGWAALLSGAQSYVGLDIVPFSAKADLNKIRDELNDLYRANAEIPDDREFPGVRPKLGSYAFPSHLIH